MRHNLQCGQIEFRRKCKEIKLKKKVQFNEFNFQMGKIDFKNESNEKCRKSSCKKE